MMMKIFGAVLIASGGYLIGAVRIRQLKNRLETLTEIYELFFEFDVALKEKRSSVVFFLKEKGLLGEKLIEGKPIQEIPPDDRERIDHTIKKIQTSSFDESIELSAALIKDLKASIEKVRNESDSKKVSLPLVTGCIGLLIAILLF